MTLGIDFINLVNLYLEMNNALLLNPEQSFLLTFKAFDGQAQSHPNSIQFWFKSFQFNSILLYYLIIILFLLNFLHEGWIKYFSILFFINPQREIMFLLYPLPLLCLQSLSVHIALKLSGEMLESFLKHNIVFLTFLLHPHQWFKLFYFICQWPHTSMMIKGSMNFSIIFFLHFVPALHPLHLFFNSSEFVILF